MPIQRLKTAPNINQPSSRSNDVSYFHPKLSLMFVCDPFESSKIAKPSIFQDVLRDIGKSFQSAITAPRMNLTGYGNATAQS